MTLSLWAPNHLNTKGLPWLLVSAGPSRMSTLYFELVAGMLLRNKAIVLISALRQVLPHKSVVGVSSVDEQSSDDTVFPFTKQFDREIVQWLRRSVLSIIKITSSYGAVSLRK